MVTRCPHADILSLFLRGRLDAHQSALLETHVEWCQDCQATLDRITREEGGATVRMARRLTESRRAAAPAEVNPTFSASAKLATAHDRPSGGDPERWPRVEGYEVVGELGRGGAAVVYRARHLGLNRLVALKMLVGSPQVGNLRERLRREAQALARLKHPNIVQVYDVGEHDGQPFCALELVDGTTLARWAGGTPRLPRVAAEIVLTIARAVEYAHQNGILHRDLKPANILLESVDIATIEGRSRPPIADDHPASIVEFRPKVADFGLATGIARMEPGEGLTETGAVLGTPSYMAPEQVRVAGGAVGPGADVYALGAILYELLTGRPPFRATGTFETLLQVAHDEPVSVARLQPGLPRDLTTICMKCMEKAPAGRYLRAADLADDLKRFLAHEPIRARPVGPAGRLVRWAKRRPARAATLLSAIGASIVAFAVVLWLWRESEVARSQAEELAASEAAAHLAAREQRDDATRARRRAERASAELVLDQSLELCERGEVGPGLVGLAGGLRRVVDARLNDLEPAFRANLSAWASHLLVPVESPPLGSSVTALAYRPDGKRVLVGQWANKFGKMGPGEAREWDPEKWVPVGPSLAHDGPVTAVAYSPDGSRVLTGGLDETVRLWDAETGTPVGVPLRGVGPVRAVAFSPNGRTFAAGGEGSGLEAKVRLRVWDARTREPIESIDDPPGAVLALAYDPTGTVLAFGCSVPAKAGPRAGGLVRQWDVVAGRPAGPELLHSSEVCAVAFCPTDGRILLTGSADKTSLLWERTTGQRVGPAQVHPYEVHAVAFAPNGLTIVTGGGDTRWFAGKAAGASLLDTLTGRSLTGPLRHWDAVDAIAVRPDGRRVVTGCRDGHARLWEIGEIRPAAVRYHPFPLAAVAFDPNGRVLISGGGSTGKAGGQSRAWEPGSGRPTAAPLEHPARVESLAAAPDGRVYATGCVDGVARAWEVRSQRPAGPPLDHSRPVESLAFTPDGRALLTAAPPEAKLWDVRSGQLLWAGLPAGQPVNVAILSPDGRLVLTGGADGVPRIWDTATGHASIELPKGGAIHAAAFSPDARGILTGDADGVVRLWDRASGRAAGPPLQHPGEVVWSVRFTADAKRIVTVAGTPYRDWGWVRFWDPYNGKPLGALPHRVAVRAVAVHPETGLICTGGWEGDVRLWDIRSGRPIGPRLLCDGAIRATEFSPDGSAVAVAGEDGALRTWAVSRPIVGEPDLIAERVNSMTKRLVTSGQKPP
jgi:eukaryotic-like serine/threonine-protein kinase